MILELFQSLIFSIFGAVLPFLKKWIYKKEDLDDDVMIRTRSSNPLIFTLGGDIPDVDVYLEVTNKSKYLDITIDRINLGMWLQSKRSNQPFIKNIMHIKKENLKKNKTKQIFLTRELTKIQTDKLKEIKDEELSVDINVYMWIETDLHQIKKEVRLERISCKVNA